MSGRATLVRNADLEPSWDLKRAREPGYLRSLTTWVGGPAGYINSNLAASARSKRCAVGLMRMPVGNRQPGVHVHSVTEIYVIVRGEVESFDGQGRRHKAGPGDCLYIPAGVPHGVEAVGRNDLELIWLHDGIEKVGISTYLEGDGPYPSDEEVRLVPFEALRARWDETRSEGLRHANWVAGPAGCDHSPGIAVENLHIAVGLTVIPPGQATSSLQHTDAVIYVVLKATCSMDCAGAVLSAGPLDAVHVPAGSPHLLSNNGHDPLSVLWVREGG